MREDNILRKDEIVTNFMGGDSYKLNPLDTLKMIAASSIFGEPSYYRSNVRDGMFEYSPVFCDEVTENFEKFSHKTTTEIFTEAIDEALSYDFKATLELALTLRTMYNMRLNPQVIMVRAAIHEGRKEFTEKYPSEFDKINQKVMARADEPATQLMYYMFTNKGNKNKIPSILKRSIANKLSSLNAYQVNKYKNAEIGMIDSVRITHANSPVIDELMTTGTVTVSEDNNTWEQLRSNGMSWSEILNTIKIGHMALLRNLRNIFTEINDINRCKKILETLKSGVLNGKQFPFRYYSAYNMINKSDVNHKSIILDALEECIDISIANMPKLNGRTMCLSDNSGSAWGTIPTEYGSVTVAEIDNLSSVIAAMASDEGVVGKFGDKLKKFDITKRNGALMQTRQITENRYSDVGGGTEGGIWKFFKDAINNKDKFDNIFIFSDQQAGTGGLYGTSGDLYEYSRKYGVNGNHINVYKLILEYRKKVNPKVNVFSVQTAGYNNVLIPQMSYRTAMLTGWTGKEILFANEYIDFWNEKDNKS